MKRYRTLNDVTPEWLAGKGIFTALDRLNVPWKNDILAANLNMVYYGTVSGHKMTAPLLDEMCAHNADDMLSDANYDTLAQMLLSVYGVNWKKQYDTLTCEYNPINNYDMKEELQENKSLTHGLSISRVGTNTDVLHDTVTYTPAVTTTNNEEVSAYNSASYVPSSKATATQSGNNKTLDEANNSHTENVTDTHSGTDTDAMSHTLTRSGNIGVTTTQQMLESERNLWLWNYFKNYVFNDIDGMLACPMYL